jgi:hypothetical protein
MPIDEAYAAKTACSHMKVYSGIAKGLVQLGTFSDCEYRRWIRECGFSHTVFNTERVLKLVCVRERVSSCLHTFQAEGAENKMVTIAHGKG